MDANVFVSAVTHYKLIEAAYSHAGVVTHSSEFGVKQCVVGAWWTREGGGGNGGLDNERKGAYFTSSSSFENDNWRSVVVSLALRDLLESQSYFFFYLYLRQST